MDYDICVIGLGYIGLPTASILASRGKRVLGVDIVPSVTETINRGEIHIEEPDLGALVRDAVQSGNLRAEGRPGKAAVYIIAVPSPFKTDNNNYRIPDTSYIEAAARSIAHVIEPGALVILESTSPVGTTERVRDWVGSELLLLGRDSLECDLTAVVDRSDGCGETIHKSGKRTLQGEMSCSVNKLYFAHCPERVLPGKMLIELVANDRICGGLSKEAAEAAREIYKTFCTGEIFVTDARTAEMCKLTENASRDVNIAFANELSLICEELNIDVWELIRLANRHPRVKILKPGPGVGGHCIAVDPWFIVDATPKQARMIRAAREINDGMPNHIVQRIIRSANGIDRPVVACFGLSFKADVDDLRESPAIEIVEHLTEKGFEQLLVVEPYIQVLPQRLAQLPRPPKLVSIEKAIREADIVVLLVDHRHFVRIDRTAFVGKTVIDTRGIWK